MNVGTLKRLLTLVNGAALLLLAGTAYGFIQHRSEMKETATALDFVPPRRSREAVSGAIQAVDLRLGRYKDAAPKGPDEPVESEQPKVDVKAEIERLGVIKGAIIVEPPYTTNLPSITFEYHQVPAGASSRLRTIALGEALEMQLSSNPKAAEANLRVPVRYKFIGCRRDEAGVWFRFDMKCDGSDIQELRWKEDVPGSSVPDDKPPPKPDGPSTSKGIFIGDLTDLEKPVPSRPPDAPAPDVVPPVVPAPVPSSAGVPSRMFDDENGTFSPTSDGVRYLRENQEKILDDVSTADYVDPRTREPRGVLVRAVRSGSAASQFGILPDDVITSINGRPVTSRVAGINVVKDELRKGKTIIQVQLLRNGAPMTKSYNTQDPETRRAARTLR
ncbi:MAG: PDZ domain-containing protein [Planctomycetaceae bacterium]